MSGPKEMLYSKRLLKSLLDDAIMEDTDDSSDFNPEDVARESDFCPNHNTFACVSCYGPITPRVSRKRATKTRALHAIQHATRQ